VPIRAFLDGEAFDPETIESMSQALSAACELLGLRDKENAATRLLATRIIDLARDGIHDRELLKAGALRGFRRRAG
jgi:hypothetical protein